MLSTKWLLSRKVSPWAGFYTLKVRELRHSSVCLVQVAAVAVGPGAGEVTCGHEHRTKQLRHIMTHYPQAELLITATNNMEYPIVTIVANHRQLLVICLVFFHTQYDTAPLLSAAWIPPCMNHWSVISPVFLRRNCYPLPNLPTHLEEIWGPLWVLTSFALSSSPLCSHRRGWLVGFSANLYRSACSRSQRRVTKS